MMEYKGPYLIPLKWCRINYHSISPIARSVSTAEALAGQDFVVSLFFTGLWMIVDSGESDSF